MKRKRISYRRSDNGTVIDIYSVHNGEGTTIYYEVDVDGTVMMHPFTTVREAEAYRAGIIDALARWRIRK